MLNTDLEYLNDGPHKVVAVTSDATFLDEGIAKTDELSRSKVSRQVVAMSVFEDIETFPHSEPRRIIAFAPGQFTGPVVGDDVTNCDGLVFESLDRLGWGLVIWNRHFR